jgi:hypothetical protein
MGPPITLTAPDLSLSTLFGINKAARHSKACFKPLEETFDLVRLSLVLSSATPLPPALLHCYTILFSYFACISPH